MLKRISTTLFLIPLLCPAAQPQPAGEKASQSLAAKLLNAAGDRQRLQLAIQQIQLQAQLLEKQLQDAQKAFQDADRALQEALQSLMKQCGADREKQDVNLQAIRSASEGADVSCQDAFPKKQD